MNQLCSLAHLRKALEAFDQGLRMVTSRLQDTLLAVREFGRRLQQNASGGTDDGSASVVGLVGDAVPHPYVGCHPPLSDLDERGELLPSLAPADRHGSLLVT